MTWGELKRILVVAGVKDTDTIFHLHIKDYPKEEDIHVSFETTEKGTEFSVI